MTGADTASELIATLSGLRRALRRRVGSAGGVAALGGSQRELVRLVRREPGIRVSDAAAKLHLAANTVSTLVSSLHEAGWISREPDPSDARSARLRLTSLAERNVMAWRDERQAVLEAALRQLEPEDRHLVAGALPALGQLIAALEESE